MKKKIINNHLWNLSTEKPNKNEFLQLFSMKAQITFFKYSVNFALIFIWFFID